MTSFVRKGIFRRCRPWRHLHGQAEKTCCYTGPKDSAGWLWYAAFEGGRSTSHPASGERAIARFHELCVEGADQDGDCGEIFKLCETFCLNELSFVDLFILLYECFQLVLLAWSLIESHWEHLWIQDGHMVHLETLGHADLAAGKTMQMETLFRLYSQTMLGRHGSTDLWKVWEVVSEHSTIFSPCKADRFVQQNALTSRKPFLVAAFWSSTSEVWWICMHQFPSSCRSLKPQWWVPRGENLRMVGMEPVVGFDWMNDGCNVWTVWNETHDQRKKMTHSSLVLFQGTLGAAYLRAWSLSTHQWHWFWSGLWLWAWKCLWNQLCAISSEGWLGRDPIFGRVVPRACEGSIEVRGIQIHYAGGVFWVAAQQQYRSSRTVYILPSSQKLSKILWQLWSCWKVSTWQRLGLWLQLWCFGEAHWSFAENMVFGWTRSTRDVGVDVSQPYFC